jgi:hypothetical protein
VCVCVCFVVANGTLFSFVPLKFLALEFCCVHACWSQVIIFSFYWRSPRDASQVCWIFSFASVCLTLVEQIRIDDEEDEANEEESFALLSLYALFIDQQKWTELKIVLVFSISFIRLPEENQCTQRQDLSFFLSLSLYPFLDRDTMDRGACSNGPLVTTDLHPLCARIYSKPLCLLKRLILLFDVDARNKNQTERLIYRSIRRSAWRGKHLHRAQMPSRLIRKFFSTSTKCEKRFNQRNWIAAQLSSAMECREISASNKMVFEQCRDYFVTFPLVGFNSILIWWDVDWKRQHEDLWLLETFVLESDCFRTINKSRPRQVGCLALN